MNRTRVPKRVIGVVVSTAMQKTAVVQVTRLFAHSRYRKIVRRRTKLFCHDEYDICNVGDRVQIKQVEKTSKRKNFAVIDMIHRAPQLQGERCEMSSLKVPEGTETVDPSLYHLHPEVVKHVEEARKDGAGLLEAAAMAEEALKRDAEAAAAQQQDA